VKLTPGRFITKITKALSQQMLQTNGKESAGVDPTKLFFLRIFFFGIKLGHFTINKFFSVCNKNESLLAKNGEILC